MPRRRRGRKRRGGTSVEQTFWIGVSKKASVVISKLLSKGVREKKSTVLKSLLVRCRQGSEETEGVRGGI